jgi:predicted dienelactone hydrolase
LPDQIDSRKLLLVHPAKVSAVRRVASLLVLGVACSACARPRVDPPAQPDVAAAGGRDTPVGVQTIEVARAGGTTVKARVWYATSGDVQTAGGNGVFAAYPAVPDGVVAPKPPAPLVILLHGSGGRAEGMAWIALGLVARGAIAVAANHPASSFGDPARRSILDVWEQPGDVRALIDQLGRSGWSARIDRGRIAVVGFSLGGASAMLLAGARLDFARVPAFCKTHRDGACEGFEHHFAALDAAFFARAEADHADRRIRAAVAIAPAFTEAMTAASLRALAPTLLVVGGRDQQLPPQTRVTPMLEHLRPPSGYREIASAQHFSFLPTCRPNAIELLAATHEEFVCQEQAGTTREQIHTEALAAITTFLGDRGVLAGR